MRINKLLGRLSFEEDTARLRVLQGQSVLPGGATAIKLDDLNDVSVSAAQSGDGIVFDGVLWKSMPVVTDDRQVIAGNG